MARTPDGFACTDEDMAAGGYVLLRDPRSRHKPSEAEREQLGTMFEAYTKLKALGWREAMYAPQDGTTFLCIEAGSAGIHECKRNDDGHFWIYDGDVWPASPILWRSLATGGPDAAE